MRVSDIETNTAGEVTGYSCPECGGALELCHDLEHERQHGPNQTDALFECVHCEQQTAEPTPDPKRTAERLYAVRVEIAWNDETDGDILCEAEELKCFESERAARRYVNGLFQAVFDEERNADAPEAKP